MALKSSTARGYTAEHRELRKRWEDLFAQGHTTPCACQHRACPHHAGPCQVIIGTDTAWDLGHTDDRRDWTGPECVPCNRSAGARASNRSGVVMTRRPWLTPRPSSSTPPHRAISRPPAPVTGGREISTSADRMAGHVVIVVGPPCSGKTTWVEQHKQPGDLVVDYDAIAQALGSPTEHDHGRSMIDRVEAARRAVLDEWLGSNNGEGNAWVILTRARQFAIVPSANVTRIVTMPTELKECERRAIRAGRSDNVVRVIRGYGPEFAALEIAATEIGIDLELATTRIVRDKENCREGIVPTKRIVSDK